MIRNKVKQKLVLLAKRTAILYLAVVLGFATLLVSLSNNQVDAAQLTERSVTISSSVGALTDVEYLFQFDWVTATIVESIIFQFCDTPLGTCTLPNSMDVDNATVTLDGHTGFPNNTDAFTIDTTGSNDCDDTGTGTETMICLTRDDTSDTSATGNDATVTLSGIVNPTIPGGQNFETVFVRVYLYSDQAYSSLAHDGTVAAAIVRQITTTGRVQERLEFCVAAVSEAVWDTSYPADCTDTVGADAWPTTTQVDLGVIDNLTVKISPVNNTVTDPANDSFGIVMLDTNASNGAEITYFPEVQTNVLAADTDQLRAFRVVPTDCAAAGSLVDQCFEDASATATEITAGSELFGIYVACLITSTGTTGGNLTVDDNYDESDNDTTEAADCENEAADGTGYEVAFDDSGTPDVLATSTSVVDDEMLVIRFAATAQSTTPTGQYTVTTTYIATPTY